MERGLLVVAVCTAPAQEENEAARGKILQPGARVKPIAAGYDFLFLPVLVG